MTPQHPCQAGGLRQGHRPGGWAGLLCSDPVLLLPYSGGWMVADRVYFETPSVLLSCPFSSPAG